jgi:hypothetical protein
MGLSYRNLDERTRNLMLSEIERDVTSNKLFLSDNLNPQGEHDYPDLLRNAVKTGTDVTLAADIKSRLNTHEKPRQLKTGAFSKPPVMRSNAHEMLAEGEFNRFYIRAVCLRAIEDGIAQVIVYRGKQVEHARSASEAKIGQAVSAKQLLDDLRASIGVDTALGLPAGPNSGLSVHLPS